MMGIATTCPPARAIGPVGGFGPAHAIERIVACRCGIEVGDLYRPGRSNGPVSLARHTAMYLQRVMLGLAYDGIARRFARHPTTAIYACRRIEDMRDDAAFEDWIASLEDTVRRAREGGAR